MTDKDDRPEQAAELRWRAEKMCRGKTAQSPDDLRLSCPKKRGTRSELWAFDLVVGFSADKIKPTALGGSCSIVILLLL